MHNWQNGPRCRDGVKLLQCHSHLVWLVFEVFIPTCTCFHMKKIYLGLVPAVFFWIAFYNGKREGGRVGRGEDAGSVKYDSIDLFLQITKNNHKLKCLQVKL